MARSKDELFSLELERPIRTGFKNDVSGIKLRMRSLDRLADADLLGSTTAIERIFDPSSFGETYEAVVSAYGKAGRLAARQAPWDTGFSLGETHIAQFIRDYVNESIARIAREQQVDIGARIQQRLSEGWSTARIVRELMGKKQGRNYQGGLIGLTERGIQSSDNALEQLLALDKSYFDRKLRPVKYDRIVEEAIRTGKPLTQTQLRDIIAAYQAKMLESRAKMLALMETTTAVNKTKLQTFIKAATAAGVPLDLLEKTWHTVGDNHVRFTHRALARQTVTLAQKFVSPSGALLDYPGDPSAPLTERAGCRCHMRIRWKKPRAER